MLARAVTMVGIGLIMALLAAVMGLDGRLDRALRRAYYYFDTPTAAEPPCLIVGFDEATVTQWGPPPWPPDRITTILERAKSAGARAIAVVEPRARLVTGPWTASPPVLSADAVTDRSIVSQPSVPLEQLTLRSPQGTLTVAGELIGRVRPELLDRDSLFVHFAPEESVLPTVPAHRLERGDIPPALLRNRILLLGLTAAPFAREIATPVGFLTPAEVHSSAIYSALTSPSWATTAWMKWLLAVVMLLFQATVVSRRSFGSLLRATAALILLAIVADGMLFHFARVTIGASLFVLSAAGACLTFILADYRQTKHAVAGTLQALAPYRAMRSGRGEEEDSAFWDRLGSLPDAFVESSSAGLFVVPAGDRHLTLRWGRSMTEQDVRERRRDVQRSPYSKALRATWEPTFMNPELGVATLLVPLSTFSRVLGFWVLNFKAGTPLDPTSAALIEYLSREGAAVLERRSVVLEETPSAREGSRLRQGIEDVRDAASRLATIHGAYQQLLSVMPVGLLIAGITGEVMYSNATMSQALSEASVPVGAQRALAATLTRLTRSTASEVRSQLRKLLYEPKPISFRVFNEAGDLLPYAFSLFRLGHGSLFGVGSKEDGPWPGTFVLTAHPLTDDAADLVPRLSRPSLAPRLSRPSLAPPKSATLQGSGIDIRELLLRLLRRLRARYQDCNRALDLEVQDPLPVLPAAAREAFTGALMAVLHDVLRHGAESSPGRLSAVLDGEEVTIRIIDPEHAIPQASLFALTTHADEVAVVPGSLPSLAQAKDLLQSLGGALEIESRIGSGTMYTARIPAGAPLEVGA